MALSYEELLKRFGIGEPQEETTAEEPKASLLATPKLKSIPKQATLQPTSPSSEISTPPSELVAPQIDELAEAIKQRDKERSQAMFFKGAQEIGAALGGIKADTSMADDMYKAASDRVGDILAKHKTDQEKLETKMRTLQAKQAEEMQDPKSEVSKQYRSFAKNLGISVPDTSTAASMEKLAPLYERYMAMREAFSDKAERRQDAKLAQQEEKAKLSDKQLQVLKDFQESQQVLGDLSADLKPGYVGPLDQMRPELLMSPEQSAYTKLLGRYKDAYRKAITGAGASSKEIEMLESRLPALGQTEANYQGALKQMIKEAQAKQAGYIDLLKRQGKDVSQFEDLVKPSSDMVKVQLPDGRTGSIPKSKLEEAVKRGAKVL